MLFKALSAHLIDVEVDYSGVVSARITFIPSDCRTRRCAKAVTGYARPSRSRLIPPTHITINLAPADLKKEGSGFDLPIAVGILGAYGALRIGHLGRFLFVGELRLDGRVRPIPAHRDPRAREGNSQSDPSRRERC